MFASESDELRDRRERLRGLRFLLRVSKDKGKYSKLQNVRQCLYFEKGAKPVKAKGCAVTAATKRPAQQGIKTMFNWHNLLEEA